MALTQLQVPELLKTQPDRKLPPPALALNSIANINTSHNSDMANKLDPRVDADLDGSKTIGGNKTRQ